MLGPRKTFLLPLLEKGPPSLMASLLLMRHGQIRANVDGLWHGSTDSPLTWRGRRQAKRAARFLKRNERISAIYTSPLERCRNTAGAVAAMLNLPVEVHPELREYAIGEWEGLPFRYLHKQHDFMNLARADLHFAPPGGESLHQVSTRMVPAIEELHERHANDPSDDKILLVSHGAALAVALATLLEDDPRGWANYPLANCSLTELVLLPQPYVNFFNQTLHL